MNKDGLKPCPFCGKQPKTHEFRAGLWTVTCKCGAESPNDSTSENGAKRIWNQRRYPLSDQQRGVVTDEMAQQHAEELYGGDIHEITMFVMGASWMRSKLLTP